LLEQITGSRLGDNVEGLGDDVLALPPGPWLPVNRFRGWALAIPTQGLHAVYLVPGQKPIGVNWKNAEL
jgi:hypothetical protein